MENLALAYRGCMGFVAIGSVLADHDLSYFPSLPPREKIRHYIPATQWRGRLARSDAWNLIEKIYPEKIPGKSCASGAHHRNRRRMLIVLIEAGEEAPKDPKGAVALLKSRRKELRKEAKLEVDERFPIIPGDIPYNEMRKRKVDDALERRFAALAKKLEI